LFEKNAALKKIGISQFVVGSPIGTNVKQAIDLCGKRLFPTSRSKLSRALFSAPTLNIFR
jgi:hypothetical protein